MTRNVLIALPPAAMTVALAVIACAEIAGAHVLTKGEPRSISEAIALRDNASAARLVEGGANVNAIGLIRAGIISDRPVLATPLETAVLVDAAAAIDFLMVHGATTDLHLSCLALDVGAQSVPHVLPDPPRCQAGGALQAVLARP